MDHNFGDINFATEEVPQTSKRHHDKYASQMAKSSAARERTAMRVATIRWDFLPGHADE